MHLSIFFVHFLKSGCCWWHGPYCLGSCIRKPYQATELTLQRDFYKNGSDISNIIITNNSPGNVTDRSYFSYVTKLSDDVTWGTMLWYKPWACKDFIVCWRGYGGESQFTNPFICSAQRMSVWFQLRAAICLLRNKLKWITRLMAF